MSGRGCELGAVERERIIHLPFLSHVKLYGVNSNSCGAVRAIKLCREKAMRNKSLFESKREKVISNATLLKKMRQFGRKNEAGGASSSSSSGPGQSSSALSDELVHKLKTVVAALGEEVALFPDAKEETKTVGTPITPKRPREDEATSSSKKTKSEKKSKKKDKEKKHAG